MSSLDEHNLEDLEDDYPNAIVENSNSNSSNSLHSSGDSIGTTSYATSQHEDFKSMTTVDSGDGDGQVSENDRNWARLPPLIVENIYSFLSRPDQSRMSFVCSRWANEFNSPSLWKTIKFHLFEHDYSTEICPEVKFARKYSYMFRHVEIICTKVTPLLISVVCRQLTLFLQAIESSSQLLTIKFIGMGRYFRVLDDTLNEGLLKTIISLFNSQKNLRTVVFHKSYFGKEQGMELLKAIFHSHSNTIKNLTLRKFVNETTVTALSHRYTSNLSDVCWRIGNVQTLEVDYTQIFEDILIYLYQKLSSGEYQLDKKKPSLSTLSVYCENIEELGFRRIQPGTWYYLTNTFPGLKVKMDVIIKNHLISGMEKFLVKEIPLQTLDFHMEMSSGIDISVMFTHLQLCKYQNHLEDLNVLWMSSIADFAGSVVPFIQSCRKLQTFHLHAKYTSMEIENALKAFLKYHPRTLKVITLWLIYLRESQDEYILKELSEKYYPLFNEQGIEFFLIADPSRRQQRREPNAIDPINHD